MGKPWEKFPKNLASILGWIEVIKIKKKTQPSTAHTMLCTNNVDFVEYAIFCILVLKSWILGIQFEPPHNVDIVATFLSAIELLFIYFS